MGIEKFLIEKNIVRDKKQANYIMIFIIIISVAFLIFTNLPDKREEYTPNAEEINYPEAEPSGYYLNNVN